MQSFIKKPSLLIKERTVMIIRLQCVGRDIGVG